MEKVKTLSVWRGRSLTQGRRKSFLQSKEGSATQWQIRSLLSGDSYLIRKKKIFLSTKMFNVNIYIFK